MHKMSQQSYKINYKKHELKRKAMKSIMVNTFHAFHSVIRIFNCTISERVPRRIGGPRLGEVPTSSTLSRPVLPVKR
jgi:hypothetical protein